MRVPDLDMLRKWSPTLFGALSGSSLKPRASAWLGRDQDRVHLEAMPRFMQRPQGEFLSHLCLLTEHSVQVSRCFGMGQNMTMIYHRVVAGDKDEEVDKVSYDEEAQQ
jgi:hypothetical protein